MSASAPGSHFGGTRAGAQGVTLRDAALFFLPLIFMTELNMISKSVIHAFLARLPEPKIVLASFSIAFAFYYTLTSCTEVNTLLAISYLRSRRALRHLLAFFCLFVGPAVALTQVVAWTPVGVWLYGDVFGAGPAAVRQAQWATFWLALSAPVLMARALAFALIMLHRRTIWITYSTLLRLLSLGGSLLVLPHVLSGASVGAAALVLCMVVESAFAWWAARPYYLALPAAPEPGTTLPRFSEMWRFAWPLWMSQSMEIGIVMTINVFLGRLGQAELALASFGVVHGLANVALSPMRNLVQTAQTLVRTRADVRVLMRFTTLLVAVFTVAIAAVFATPLRHPILSGVMGLSGELLAYSEPALLGTFAMAAFWAYAALFRGLLAGARRTATVAVSAVSRLVVVLLVGSATLVFAGLNGAVIGMVAWAATYVVETAVLGWRLASRRPGAAPLFPDALPAAGQEPAR